MKTMTDFIFLDSKITADGECTHEIKIHLILGRKVMANLDRSVQFSPWVMSDSLWLHELQHARPPCPSTTPEVYPNPCPLSRWCHPTVSSSVVPFYSCPQSFQALMWFITGYWIQFPVLYSRTLLFIHSGYISLHLLIPNSHRPPW